MTTKTSKTENRKPKTEIHVCETPEDTFAVGELIGARLRDGDAVLLSGDLGAGKTLFTKGVLYALDFDIDEVNSPSFTLVNLYKTENYNVYHIDFWRLDKETDVAAAVGLDEIFEDEKTVLICEWPERLENFSFPKNVFRVRIEGDGDDPRRITIEEDGN